MMRFFQNGEPFVYRHHCPDNEKGKMMNLDEKREFLVQNLLEIFKQSNIHTIERYPHPTTPLPVEYGGRDWSLIPDIVRTNFGGTNKKAYYYVVPLGTSLDIDIKSLPQEIQDSYVIILYGSVFCLTNDAADFYEKGADYISSFIPSTILPLQENLPIVSGLTDQDLAEIVTRSWQKLDVPGLRAYLDKDFHLYNEYVFDEISSRDEYMMVLERLFHRYRRDNAIEGVKLIFDTNVNEWAVLFKERSFLGAIRCGALYIQSRKGRIVSMRIKKIEQSEFDDSVDKYRYDVADAFFTTVREIYPNKTDQEIVKAILSDLDFAKKTNEENEEFAKMVQACPEIAIIYAGWYDYFKRGENPNLALLELPQALKDLISGRISSDEYLTGKTTTQEKQKTIRAKEEKKPDLVRIEFNDGEFRNIIMNVERELVNKMREIEKREPDVDWRNIGFEWLGKAQNELDQEKAERGIWYNGRKLEEDDLKNIEQGGFSDVAGLAELKDQLRSDFIDVLHEPERAEKLGISLPNGMLLYGPPGCGKTLFATKFAEEAGCNFTLVNCSDIASTYIHGTQQKIAKVFDEAIENAPSIIFFDEVEAMIPKRGAFGNEHTKTETNEFLTQLNHCGKKGIFVIGATNHPQDIDEAALRSGRLDMKVYFPTPDAETRASLFIHSLKNKALKSKIDIDQLVEKTDGYISADIKKIVELTARNAFRKKLDYITMDMILEVLKSFKPTVSKATIKEHEAIRDKFEGRKQEYQRIGFC